MGVDNEEKARESYIELMKARHKSFLCKLSGFVFSGEKPFTGASAAAIATCECHGIRVVEIKCPFKHKDNTPLKPQELTRPSAWTVMAALSKTTSNIPRSKCKFSQLPPQMLTL